MHRDQSAGRASENRNSQIRTNRIDALLFVNVVLLRAKQHPGLGSSHGDADALEIFFGEIELPILNGEIRRDQSELRQPVHAPGFLAAEPFLGFKIFHLSGDLPGAIGFLKNGRAPRGGNSTTDARPKIFHTNPNGTDNANSGDDDTSFADCFHIFFD